MLAALKVESAALYIISKRMLDGEMTPALKEEIRKSMYRLWAADDF